MKILRAGVIYALGNVAAAAVPFLLLPILTRALPPAEYGRIIAFSLLVTLAGTVAGLNVHAAIGVAWFKRTPDDMMSFNATALLLAAATSLLFGPLMALVLWLFPKIGAGINPLWGIAAAWTAGANVIVQCRLVLWQSQQKALYSAALQVFASTVNVGLSLAAVLTFHWGGSGRNAAIAAASLLNAMIAVSLLMISREIRWAPTRKHAYELVLFGLPLVVHIFAGVLLSTADRWAVSIKLDIGALGIYGAVSQLGAVMAVLADAFVKAYNPWLYSKLASPEARDKLQVVGAIYAAGPLFLLGGALVGVAMFLASTLLLGPLYRAAANLLPWFVLGGAFIGIYVSSSVLFFFASRTALLAATTSAAAIVGSLLSWVLVSRFGLLGAAAGYCLTQASLAAFVTAVAMMSFELPWSHPGLALSTWFRALTASAQSV